jgi:sulfonate dioxygenase
VYKFVANRTFSVAWHSDVLYEQQPPGTTFLYIFDKPKTGGNTLFVDALHGLKARHSAHEEASRSLTRGGIIRTHPATGEKAVYANPTG